MKMAMLSLLLPSFLLGLVQEKKETEQESEVALDKVEKAIDKALEWLSTKEDNRFTEFVIMAFGVNGYGTDDPKYGKIIRGWVENTFKSNHAWNIWTPSVGTMALSQTFSQTKDKELQSKIKKWVEKAVKYMLEVQEKNVIGGWTYHEGKNIENIYKQHTCTFVTCWVLQALLAARQIGVNVPKESFKKAGQSLLKMYGEENGRGHFAYSRIEKSDTMTIISFGGSGSKPRCGSESLCNNTAGPLALACCDLSGTKEVDNTIRHILGHNDVFPYKVYTGSSYSTSIGIMHGMQLALVYKDKYDWKKWMEEVRKQVLTRQTAEGAIHADQSMWRTKDEPFSTALVVMALGMAKGNAIWLKDVTVETDKK